MIECRPIFSFLLQANGGTKTFVSQAFSFFARAHTHPARAHTQWPHTQAFDPALPEGSERAIFDKELDFVSLEVASNLIAESNNGVCVS